MMKPKRRRRQSPDKECWSNRADVLDDFFTPPDHLQSQHNIEWSSSDEEDLFSKSKVSTSTVMRLTPVEDKILDAFPSEAASLHSKLNFITPSNTETQSLPNNHVSECEGNVDLIARHLSTHFSSYTTTLPNERKNRGLCGTKISQKGKSEIVYGAFGEPAKTPIKSVCQKDSRKVLATSPVVGLHRTQCASKNLLTHNIEVPGSAQCYSDSLKVLGRTFTKRCSSSIQGLSGGSGVKKKFSSATKSNDSDCHPAISPLTGLSQVYSKLQHRNESSLEDYSGSNSPVLGSSRKKDMGKKDAEYMRVRVKGRNLHTELNRIFPKKSSRNNSEEHSKNVTSHHQSIANKTEEMHEYALDVICEDEEVQEVTTQPDTSGKMNQPCTHVQEEEINEYGYNILSQSDSEGHEVRSQSDTSGGEKLLDIDVCESPLKDSQASSPVLLKGSGDPTISSESTLSPKENIGGTNEISKNVGFQWVRMVQQHTPEKQACQPVEFVDSTKKKERKDGEAARLRRFINSWQSDVQVWLHETSVSSLKTRPPKIGETSVNLFSPGSATSHIKKELHYEKPSKSLLQTVGKDKIDIDSSQSSVGYETITKCKTEEKKFFTVKILKLDMLQGNAALCEAYGEFSSEFPKSIKEDPNSSPQQFKLAEPLKYYVYFSFGDMSPNLHAEDKLAIYAPWHYLEIPAQKIPVLFVSFFKVIKDDAVNSKLSNLEKFSRKKGRIEKRNIPPLQAKKTCVVEWSCSCVVDISILPSMCDSRKPKAENMHEFQEVIDSKEGAPTLRSVKNASQELYQDDHLRAGTVSEAVEKCAGPSVRQSCILVRVHRVVSHRKKTQNIDKWEVIAQDANGIFCTIDIPNRPFVREMTEIIENGEGKTWYFTHINIVERLTDSQNPGLFSMISSFHHSYQRALQNNPLLCPLLVDHVTSPSQTFCYVFSVNLGITKVFSKEEVVIPLTLPEYSLEDICQITANSQRGSVCFLILYKRGDFLYVMSETKESSDEEPLEDCPPKTECKEGNSNIKKFSRDDAKNLIVKVEVSSKTTLPRWIPSDGTIMMYVYVKDAAIWYGNMVIDEYSVMQPVDKKSDITLSVLVSILKPFSSRSNFQDLAVVSAVSNNNSETFEVLSRKRVRGI
ncbi:uncharacterized protein [Macrobrachium rosenbergii]|uniref:uncharacterized protein isoform X2 n=1 Tax=Macrobrachium rosenbergii TaxID=79674 RepID=UPI0034D67A3B